MTLPQHADTPVPVDDGPSCTDRFLTVIAVCRDLGLTGVDDVTVRRPHRTVDEFRYSAFAADARRLAGLSLVLAESMSSGASRGGDVAAAPGPTQPAAYSGPIDAADWSGRSGVAAGGVLRVIGADVSGLALHLDTGAAATARASAVLEAVLDRHRRVLDTVSRPRLGGFDLEALPAALNSGALSPHSLRGEVQARLEYAETAGLLASEAITVALTEVADAWATPGESDGELVLADLR